MNQCKTMLVLGAVALLIAVALSEKNEDREEESYLHEYLFNPSSPLYMDD